jgi:soluble lytic murein transglycosylase-like protein
VKAHKQQKSRGRHRHGKRHKVQSMLLVGAAAFFAPHAGKLVPKSRSSSRSSPSVSVMANPPIVTPLGVISTETEFRLPPEFQFDDIIREAAHKYSVREDLVRGVIRAESAFDPMAVSRVGAQGLMQLMPALSKELGVTDPFDPRQNIMAGTRYLAQLLNMHDGNIALALASYNAGPGAVDKYNGVPPFRETRHYVKSITDSLDEP